MPSRAPAPNTNANNLKQSPIPVVSRTMPIVNADGTVTRSGQLLLEQLQPPTTIYGPHSSRPDPSNTANGAVYIETDRGSIYQNWNGVWQFITGTMWATLNPDQRPTDLGINDGGFDFRTTDDPAREFIWSQTEWIEATPVRYGTHAARLAVVVATVIDQLLWVETDRGAIYQLQNATTWQYLAGTMWGTMVPDQRPTDLGTHDAGFDFRSTDLPAREFIWSQTAWAEVTSISGGANLTHPNVVTKVGTTGQIVEGGITDQSAANSGSVQISASGRVGIGIAPGGYTLRARPAADQNLGVGPAGAVTGAVSINAINDAASANTPLEFRASLAVFTVGNVAITNLPSASPGAGTRQLWYDPADGNRVKFAV